MNLDNIVSANTVMVVRVVKDRMTSLNITVDDLATRAHLPVYVVRNFLERPLKHIRLVTVSRIFYVLGISPRFSYSEPPVCEDTAPFVNNGKPSIDELAENMAARIYKANDLHNDINEDRLLYTAAETARITGIGYSTVTKWASNGTIPSIRNGRGYILSQETVDRLKLIRNLHKYPNSDIVRIYFNMARESKNL